MNENEIGDILVACAIQLYRDLGPGLLETVYEVNFWEALMKDGITRTINGQMEALPRNSVAP